MASLTVSPRAQAVYPDGLQDSFIIRNNGPWTIYVDSDSSISETTSHAVPPTGTMPWDAHRPLWMLCSSLAGSLGGSDVIITRNSTPSVFTNEIEGVVFEENWTTTSTVMNTGTIECTGFNTLKFLLEATQMAIPVTAAVTAAQIWQISISWFDRDGDYVGHDTIKLPGEWNGGAANGKPFSKAYIAVKGAYFRVDVATQQNPLSAHLKIVGTTRVIPGGMYPGGAGLVHGSPEQFVEGAIGSDCVILSLGGLNAEQKISLPSISSNVHMNVFCSGLSNPALLLFGCPLEPTSLTYRFSSAMTMAAGATALDAYQVLPRYLPSYLLYWPPAILNPGSPAPATFNVSLTWY